MNTYTQLIDKNKGENCFILGAGPSLFSNMNNYLFYDLKKHGIIITVNSAILACDPHYWISCDHLCVNWSWWPKVKNSKCIKIVRNSWLKYKDDIEGFYIFSPRSTPEDAINFEDEGLMYCNSTNSAIDLGIKFGCKNIFILGLDHNAIEGKHHFWQFFEKPPRQIRPAQGPWPQQKNLFPIHLQSYKALKSFAKYKKCEIYNCNPESKVDVFKKIKFEDIEKYLQK